MARKKATAPAPFHLHEFEREVLYAFCHIQAERTPLNDARGARWLKMAAALRAGRPLQFDGTVQEFE